MKGQGQTIEI